MKNKIIAIIFPLLLGLGFIFTVCTPDKDISYLERRRLATKETLKEDFTANLDAYLSDQFPKRNSLLAVNSLYERFVLLNADSNGSYFYKGHMIDKNYPLNEKNLTSFIEKINHLAQKYSQNNRVFYSIIPDKSYYLDSTEYLKIDFNSIFEKLKTNLPYDYIDISQSFTIDDYYRTDIHLKQSSYFKVTDTFLKHFDVTPIDIEYERRILKNFYGASFSKFPFNSPDEIEYYTNNRLEEISSSHLEYGRKPIYDFTTNKEVDLYNIFLSGPSALIEIENDESATEKELIIFRDSFASSFAPLLVPYYRKITLIDLRYIQSNRLDDLVDFENKDILFLYSTLLINNSNLLKIPLK